MMEIPEKRPGEMETRAQVGTLVLQGEVPLGREVKWQGKVQR